MVIASFLVKDNKRRFRFFKETFRLAYISMNIALYIFFFTWSNIEIDFVDYHLH